MNPFRTLYEIHEGRRRVHTYTAPSLSHDTKNDSVQVRQFILPVWPRSVSTTVDVAKSTTAIRLWTLYAMISPSSSLFVEEGRGNHTTDDAVVFAAPLMNSHLTSMMRLWEVW